MKLHTIPVLALLVVGTAIAQNSVLSPDAVVKDAAKYDGKTITVRGQVLDFKQKTSKKGNPYFVFKLATQDKANAFNVYGHGTLEPALKEKAKVEVTGKFAKEKTVSTFTIKNEIDVSGKDKDSKPGVKVLDK